MDENGDARVYRYGKGWVKLEDISDEEKGIWYSCGKRFKEDAKGDIYVWKYGKGWQGWVYVTDMEEVMNEEEIYHCSGDECSNWSFFQGQECECGGQCIHWKGNHAW